MTYEDDIALLAEDIKRWAGADARITEAVDQWMKLHLAEVDALAFEVRDIAKLVRETTEREAERIRTEEHLRTVRWVNHNDNAMGW